ncbi:MAG: tRNA pseudouridine(55) synthase TruB [Acidobacteriaceae bacterium]|nr:tRNA pseudouridine(55) synthase TruB [Acidobacteriaceae bacterium]
MNGIVLIDKPAGCTSHDVVNRWRRLANTKRAGHLGTLDPMATGLLVVLTGAATRLMQFFEKEEKAYEAEIRLGVVSDTYDADGDVKETGIRTPDAAAVEEALGQFRGRIRQTPPPFSAKKIKGVPAYKLARKAVPVELKPVEVEVRSLEIESVSGHTARIVVTVSSGTYVRSLAHDLGQRLGCGAILNELRRTRVGPFHAHCAKTLEQLEEMAGAGRLSEAIVPAAQLLPAFPAEYVDAATEAQIRQGRDFRTSPFVVRPGAPFVKAISRTGELIAVGELRMPNLYHPSIVFEPTRL